MAKMCMFSLIKGASCLPVALRSELPALCQTDPMFCHRFLDAVQSVPQNSECPCLKEAEVSQPFLERPMDLPQTREDCVHLTQSPLISALAPFSSSSHLPASPMLFEDDGSVGHIPPAKRCKAKDAQTCPSANPTQCSLIVLIPGKQARAFLLWATKGKLLLATQVLSHLVLVQTPLCLHALVHTFLHNS